MSNAAMTDDKPLTATQISSLRLLSEEPSTIRAIGGKAAYGKLMLRGFVRLDGSQHQIVTPMSAVRITDAGIAYLATVQS